MSLRRFIALFSLVVLFGAGCGTNPFTDESIDSSLATDDPVALAQRVLLAPEDRFEIKQLIGGKEGTRYVLITKFLPMQTASLAWESAVEQETAASKQAREAYEKKLLEEKNPKDLLTPPQVQMEELIATGTLATIDLARSMNLLPPSYWEPSKHMDLQGEKTALWLSENAFQELARTSTTVLNIGLTDEATNRWLKNMKELKAFYDRLKNNVQAQPAHKDLTLVEAEKQFIEWPLRINNRDVNVSAIRAKNWFGEFVILNNRQNPMILSLSINPLAFGTAQAVAGEVDPAKWFGYEIKNLEVQAFRHF